MQKQAFERKKVAIIAVAVSFAALPMTAVAGGYGTAGVADDSVSQYAAQGTVFCPRLEEQVPERLYADMDCGGTTGMARSAVAPDRVENRPGLGNFFRNLRHEPRPSIRTDDDNPERRIVEPDGPGNNPQPSPKPTPPTSTASVNKWERLSDFGVNQDNFWSQSQSFRDSVMDYRSTNGFDGDWSGFNPN